MAQIARLVANIPMGTANHPVAHGLVGTPNIIGLLHECGPHISIGATAANATNVYITNANMGAPENAVVLAWLAHSIVDGTNQIKRLTSIIPGNTPNHPVAHGLVRAPSIVFLMFGSGANIQLGATASDSTNIYITNTHGANPQTAEILVMAPHSIIA